MVAPWFYLYSDSNELEQGDIIRGVEMYMPIAKADFQIHPDEFSTTDHQSDDDAPFETFESDVIVLSQSCDLAHASDANGNTEPDDLVLVCRILPLEEFKAAYPGSSSNVPLERIRNNQTRLYFMLGPAPYCANDLSVACLKDICIFPRLYLEAQCNGKERERMHAGLREGLGATFGDQFSKVAIDTKFEIPKFHQEKSVEDKLKAALNVCPKATRTPLLEVYVPETETYRDLKRRKDFGQTKHHNAVIKNGE